MDRADALGKITRGAGWLSIPTIFQAALGVKGSVRTGRLDPKQPCISKRDRNRYQPVSSKWHCNYAYAVGSGDSGSTKGARPDAKSSRARARGAAAAAQPPAGGRQGRVPSQQTSIYSTPTGEGPPQPRLISPRRVDKPQYKKWDVRAFCN